MCIYIYMYIYTSMPPCQEKFYKLHTVPICYLSVFYKLAWAWGWV